MRGGALSLGSVAGPLPGVLTSLRSVGTSPGADGPSAAVDPVMKLVSPHWSCALNPYTAVSQNSHRLSPGSAGSGVLNPQSRAAPQKRGTCTASPSQMPHVRRPDGCSRSWAYLCLIPLALPEQVWRIAVYPGKSHADVC
jgi:hypothetical protein